MPNDENETRRLDQWLWYARLFKSRSLAGRFCQTKKILIDGSHAPKASTAVQVGNVLSFTKDKQEKVITVKALGNRRGPAAEAQALYEDLSPPPPTKEEKKLNTHVFRARGTGRPTKAERRAMEKLRPDLK